MADALALWSHALAALLFAALALWSLRRERGALPRLPLAAMLGTTAVCALATAGLGGDDAATRLADGARMLALLCFMFALQRRRHPRSLAVATVYGVVAGVVTTATLLQFVAAATAGGPLAGDMSNAAVLLRIMSGVAALMLVQTLYAADDRGDVRLVALGIALIWLADLNLATVAHLTGQWPVQLLALRGMVVAGAAAMFGAAIQRGDRATVRMSRTIAYRSLSLVAIGGYFALLAIVTSGLSTFVGGASARIYQTALVFGSTAAVLTLVSSPWLRAWAKVKVAKHLFSHRYDYRGEWLRFTATLGTPEDAAPLAERVVKAVADLTDSPAGLLLVPDGDALGMAASWNWPEPPLAGAGADFARHLAGERVVELDPLRRGTGDRAELSAVPQWMLDDTGGWAVVPLMHLGRLVGAILLARPALDRALDWEDFDLLKVAGRQAASYLAEARAQDALAEGQRFDEFNRRFAFIVHDIKNLVSGLSLVARNAQRHAENPAFRADMVATLQDLAAKLNALLARLSANHRGRAEPPVAVALIPLAERIAAAHRATHPIVVTGDRHATALVDAARLEQIAGHLLLNAIEASDAASPVTIAVADRGSDTVIAVIDEGCGMTPAFVRDQLFRPFVSSKPAGFGIGAFEARQLAEAMDGRIEVDSREGEGSTFRIVLPSARASAHGTALGVAA